MLAPQSQHLAELQASIQKAFPDFNDTVLDEHGNHRGFNAHLSMGQCKHHEAEQQQQVSPPWPVTTTVLEEGQRA